MLLVCLNKSSSTGQAIAAARHFAVNILGEGQADAAMRFAGKGDKFAGQPIVRGVAGAAAARGRAGQPRVPRRRGGHRRHALRLPRARSSTRPGRHGAPLAYFRGQFGRLELEQDDDAFRDIRARVLSRELPAGRAAQPRRGRRARGRPARLGLPRAHQAHRRGARHAHRRRPVRRDPAHRRVGVRRAWRRAAPSSSASPPRTVGRLSRRAAGGVPRRGARTRPAPQERVRHRPTTSTSTRAFHEYFVGLAGSPRWSTRTAASTRRR